MRLVPLLGLVFFGCAGRVPAPAHVEAGPLPFIEDDYPRALAEARAQRRPLFVETWAPWCHTCRFVRSYVLSDQALQKHAGRFVWLSVDIDKEQNAAFIEKFRSPVVPTFFVIDGASEQLALTRAAGVDRTQLLQLFDEGERALHTRDRADRAAAEADRLAAEGRAAEAARAYRGALELGGPKWPGRERTLESLVGVLSTAGDVEACATLAANEAPGLPRQARFANVVSTGLGCALSAPREATWRAGAVTTLESLTRSSLALPLGADDRSGLYSVLVDARTDAGDQAATRRLAGEWLAFLEAEAAKSPTPDARAVFDPHRLNAALALGDPARALPALVASERDLPNDYNPPARQAIALLELGRYDEGLRASERALKKVYGPRRLRVEETRAELYRRKGDRAAARRTLEEAIRLGESLPRTSRTLRALEHLRGVLAKL
jgi:tetratricopeptide (TPR) repeat protein